jgi:hypothetical protein
MLDTFGSHRRRVAAIRPRNRCTSRFVALPRPCDARFDRVLSIVVSRQQRVMHAAEQAHVRARRLPTFAKWDFVVPCNPPRSEHR